MSVLFRSLLLLALPGIALSADVFVPAELEGWQDWVLEGKEYRECPFYYRNGATARPDFLCQWPGELELVVTADGGRFSQRWSVIGEDAWLPLPGDTSHWPDRVTINGSTATVVERSGAPGIRVSPGDYTVTGRLAWDERPGVLRVPPQSGLVALTVDGERIASPEITRNTIFLGERRRETAERDAVSVSVYRLVADAVPTRLATRLTIEVSGSVREELFGPLLPEGFVPVAIDSVLPVRLEPDGRLRVQVRPGRWPVTLVARAPGVQDAIELETSMADSEIWSYQADDRLRVTAAEGLEPVDPIRVQVPDEWQELPAFRVREGDVFTVVERSRGMAAVDNELVLGREMWFDFSGDGFVVRDQIGGTMRSGWRLDMQPPFTLASATEYGENLLVTSGEVEGETGIEVRRSDVDVVAIGRTEARGSMPVTGWATPFASVSSMLFLPPGHKLLAAPGADGAGGSWVGQWQLLDYFLVLIITIAAWKLFGRGTGIIALFALTLSYNELGAPAWLWLNLLAGVALLRVTPVGRLRTTVRTYFGVSALLLVFALIPFIAGQLTVAIYPQLEPQYGYATPGRFAIGPSAMVEPAAAPAEVQRARKQGEAMLQADMPAESIEEIVVTGAKVTTNYARYAPNAIVQAGPGIPSWQWNAYRLRWSGPVSAEQDLRLMILPRWFVTVARFAEVALLLAFAAAFAAEVLKRRINLPGGLGIGRSAGSLLVVGVLGMTMAISPAEAQTPDRELLKELETRLLKPPECAPTCADVVAATVSVGADSVAIELSVHALESVAIPLPSANGGWRPTAVAVNGAGARVLRTSNGSLWLQVAPGRQRVTLRGGIGEVDSLEIPFPAPPRVIEVNANGWFVAGIQDRRLLSGSLQLSRLRSDDGSAGTPRWESSRFPAFVSITRSIELGLDWRVTTTVNRIAPIEGALSLELPLITGESVVTEDLEVEDGRLKLTMNPRQSSVTWQSNLPRTSPLELTAAAGEAWTETWFVGAGAVWHAEFSGVPETAPRSSSAGVRMAEFHPRGGESLTVVATRPEAVEGSTLAFDSVELDLEQGARTANVELSLSYRATRGKQHVIRLPESAQVTEVLIDWENQPLRAVDGELTVPILPGEHQISISWRQDGDVSFATLSPEVDIGAPAGNIRLNTQLEPNRWLLATNGPRLGPAVLYWSELVVLILIAVILGRTGLTPLRTWHWLLLGLGFSTFNWPAMGFVVVWLLAVGARERWRVDLNWWKHNLVQVGLIVLTVIALGTILASLPQGLLGLPDMDVRGDRSYGNSLSWFADRSESLLPQTVALTVPIWVYKVLILAWALWLSFALISWLPWTWRTFAQDGFFRSRKGGSGTAGGEPAA